MKKQKANLCLIPVGSCGQEPVSYSKPSRRPLHCISGGFWPSTNSLPFPKGANFSVYFLSECGNYCILFSNDLALTFSMGLAQNLISEVK